MKIYEWQPYNSPDLIRYVFVFESNQLWIKFNGQKIIQPVLPNSWIHNPEWKEITDKKEINLLKMKYL